MDLPVISVGKLTADIKSTLETDFDRIIVEGEVSEWTRARSGHIYFSLKDSEAKLRCVMWGQVASRRKYFPNVGDKVQAFGSVSVYAPRGDYQFTVLKMQPAGVGERQLAFDALKQKLFAEGLFDTENKKAIPQFPKHIGVVTSGAGAAWDDIRTVIARRFPLVKLTLCPTLVQGNGAAEKIAKSIQTFNNQTNEDQPDVLIVGRGGGSAEDLWAFNEEPVARAIFTSEIPIISAVGHEIDFSIADFVADERAGTPSIAAEIAVPDKEELLNYLAGVKVFLHKNLSDKIKNHRQQVENLLQHWAFRRPAEQVPVYRQTIDRLAQRLDRAISVNHNNLKVRLYGLQEVLKNQHPHKPLERGFAFVNRINTGVYSDEIRIRSAETLSSQDQIKITFVDGEVRATVSDD